MDTDQKICPYCGETIKAVAIRCKHCKSDLNLNRSYTQSSDVPKLDKAAENETAAVQNYKKTQKQNQIYWVIGLVLLSVFLIAKNPNEADFAAYASTNIKQHVPSLGNLLPADSSDSTKMALTGLGNAAMYAGILAITERENYILFSVYTVDLTVVRAFNPNIKNIKALGIGGTFISL